MTDEPTDSDLTEYLRTLPFYGILVEAGVQDLHVRTREDDRGRHIGVYGRNPEGEIGVEVRLAPDGDVGARDPHVVVFRCAEMLARVAPWTKAACPPTADHPK